MNDISNDNHREAMKALKAEQDARISAATEEKSLLIVNTGDGKGKSTSGFGLVIRNLGWNLPVGIVQFGKSKKWITGEARFFERFSDLVTHSIAGDGFTWDTQDREADTARARAGWEEAKAMISSGRLSLVLLDEINIMLSYRYLPEDEVVSFLATKRPARTHVVATGRGAPEALCAAADLVTEMREVKHPFHAGIKAQRGVEF
ncbi:cob(I)yrinic acid a,c-diamide adenosyltransferase [Candidatus Raskinella chloraquaticus]|uniref:cob(I)yrinic acid a,c-diamide adenosyltransferase n=1 Tax=Candidatus Raskinella chloraquaticus TaxID=1951219 RepID=UPI003670B412